jgi:hypothetical protein
MTPYNFEWKPLVVLGLASGLLQIALGIVLWLSGAYFAPWSGPLSLVMLAACVAAGIWWYVSRVLGGRSTYLTALTVGLVIAVSTGLLYVTYNVVSVTALYSGFLEEMARARFASLYPSGLNEPDASQALATLRAQTTLGTVVGSNLRAFCLFGTIFSALAAIPFRAREGAAPRLESQGRSSC